MAGLLAGCGLTTQPEEGERACPTEPECNVNTLLSCSDAGVLVQSPCGEDRCADDGPSARCVPADALPCNPRSDEPRCVNGHIVDCDEDSGYLLERSCGAGMLCVGQDNTARCDQALAIICRPSRWTVLCVDGELFTCSSESGRVEVSDDC